jgi:hypothetical protein
MAVVPSKAALATPAITASPPCVGEEDAACGLSIRRGVFVEFCGALAAAAWEVQLAQLLVFDRDSAQTAQAIRRVVGW